jgi:glycosyltransferase involved in cell wall biosynthesis
VVNTKLPKISVLIRTKNEEKWIGHSLKGVFNQKVDAEVEVIIIDNNSTDYTVEVAKRYPISKAINISEFLPGRALNDGIRASTGDYIACVSAHCIPKDGNWLSSLLANFVDNPDLAGVYGRQLPLGFTGPIDKRDLLTVFGQDKRVQIKDYFFHNANSMVPRKIWDEIPFDEGVTNIEDRVWGKQVIEAGYEIIYEPKAAVYHHHGLHQGNTRERAEGVVSILERVDEKDLNDLPEMLAPEKTNVAAVMTVIGKLSEQSDAYKSMEKAVNDLQNSCYVNSIYLVADEEKLSNVLDIEWLDRKKILNADSISLNKLMQHVLELIEGGQDYPESILYVNHDYVNRPDGIFDELIVDAQYKGCDTVFPGLVDYGHYWYHKDEGEFEQTDPSLEARDKRDPLYKALYGLGCLTSSWVIRSGKLVGGKVGILKIEDTKYVKRCNRVLN